MNLNSCWQISSKQIRWLVSLPQLHLSPLLCASVTPPPPPPPLLLYFLCHRRLLSCSRLNPDRHCLSVVMATIRRSLSTANCCRGIYFSWCDSSLCKASLSVSLSLLAVLQRLHVSNHFLTLMLLSSDENRADRNRWLMSHEILFIPFFWLHDFLFATCVFSLLMFSLRNLLTGIVVITAVQQRHVHCSELAFMCLDKSLLLYSSGERCQLMLCYYSNNMIKGPVCKI